MQGEVKYDMVERNIFELSVKGIGECIITTIIHASTRRISKERILCFVLFINLIFDKFSVLLLHSHSHGLEDIRLNTFATFYF